MRLPRFGRSLVAVFVLVAFLAQGTWALAGTTGTLSGTLVDSSTGRALSGVKINAVSPSQSATVSTDATGHFNFLNLSPDTYLVSASSSGYEPFSVSGVTVQADQTRTLELTMQPTLRVIGRVTSRAATDLVKPGTTADVYSVNATQQDKFSPIGGGGNLNSAWSAITTVPGVFVTPGQNGYIGAGPSLSIRGGDYDQIGYEIDGVPVNRAFDNYPSGPASSLGQQELQVYTGAAPANAEAQGLSGFINQVIRNGTRPGFGSFDGGIGGPSFYHKASAEVGGATPNRNFSYYLGLGGYNQDFRAYDQFNGQGVQNTWGGPLNQCAPNMSIQLAPSCYTNGVFNGNTAFGSYVLGLYPFMSGIATVADRDSVLNMHFGLPHKNGTKDDIQFLGVINFIQNQYFSSTNDQGGPAYLNAIGVGIPTYFDGYQYNGASGVALPANYQANATRYFFPNTPANRAPNSIIPYDARDGFLNNQNIFKVQYTHQMGDNAFLKVYGYTYYSDWLNTGPQTIYSNYVGAVPGDYELSSHTRGVSASFVDQITPQHLVTLQGAYTTSQTLRANNTEFLDGVSSSRRYFAVLTDSSNPLNGLCYTAPAAGSTVGTPTTCTPSGPRATFTRLANAYNGTVPAATGTCGGGPCQWLIVNRGPYATFNTVSPGFGSISLQDQWRPTPKWNVVAGLRMDSYAYKLADTSGGPDAVARSFWYTSYNLDTCLDSNFNLFDKVKNLGLANPTLPCPAGYTAANFTNPSGSSTTTYTVWQPRLAFTYTMDPATVVRASYGRFTQAPNSAFEQYNALQPNAPALLYGTYGFQKYGFTTPNHPIPPATSNNLDLSLEHQFPGQLAVKVTPFLRTTQNQIQQFYLNQQTNFVSGLNVGKQTSSGFELEVDKGDFARNGLAAKLSFTYTNSYIKYQALSNGTTIITPLNNQISAYNQYTSFCATNFSDPRCGSLTAAPATASACFSTAGAPAPCTAAAVANPYYNAPVQGLLSTGAGYYPYSLFPAGIASAYNGYGAPYFGTLVLQYKRDKWALTPALQIFGGQRYGAPSTTSGVDPTTCTGTLASAIAGDPRYPYSAPGGAPFDASTCGTLGGGIPNVFTKAFDGIGAFVAPMQVQLHLQASYNVSPSVSLVATFSNLINQCTGGTKVPFSVANACGYTVPAQGTGPTGGPNGATGNLYNPGQALQPYANSPYTPFFPYGPFNAFLDLRIKL